MELGYVFFLELGIGGQGATPDNPLWYDQGLTIIEAYITFKADPDEPAVGLTVYFTTDGGGDFYDYYTQERLGRAAIDVTNDSGIALLYYYTAGEWETYYDWIEVAPGEWEQVKRQLG